MPRFIPLLLIVLIGLSLLVLANFGRDAHAQAPERTDGLDALVGNEARIYLRGDATGAIFNDRVPSIRHLIARTGKVVSADERWVVIDAPEGRCFFPREAVALVEVAAKK